MGVMISQNPFRGETFGSFSLGFAALLRENFLSDQRERDSALPLA